MVFAYIAVGEHIVAQLLGVAQACAVAQHDPGVGSQNCDVVRDVFGVGRPYADVDHGDAGMVFSHQVVARHLRQTRRRAAQRVSVPGRHADTPSDHIAGFNKRDVFAFRILHRGVAVSDELVDVELVIGEQHKVLEMLRAGARVMAQPVQGIVHPRCCKQRQR